MKTFKIPNRDQNLLYMEVDLKTFVSPENPAYIIDRLVDCLDTSAIENKYNLDIWQGENPLHPKTYIKVILLSIHNCRFSLRKIEHDTEFNIIYRWMTGDKVIDHSTIGKFIVRNLKEITDLFTQVIKIAIENSLLEFDMLAIDTIKLRANASFKQHKDLDGIQKEQEKIKKKIQEILENPDETDTKEENTLSKRMLRLQGAENELKQRMEANETVNKINVTDHDCDIVQQANGEKNPGYCITTATDTGNDIITDFKIDATSNDAAKLIPVIEGSNENTNNKHDTIIADSGFSSIDNLEALKEMGQDALIPDRRMEVENSDDTAKGEYDRSKFRYNKDDDYYRCPQKKKLTNIGTIEQNGRKYNRYGNKITCSGCPVREKCTKSAYRIITRDTNEIIKEEMRKSMKKNKEKYTMRAHSAESPYGDIKHNKKYRIFMRRGLEKVKTEVSLIFMLHNILKIGKRIYDDCY